MIGIVKGDCQKGGEGERMVGRRREGKERGWRVVGRRGNGQGYRR